MLVQGKYGKTHLVVRGARDDKHLPLIALHGGPGGTCAQIYNLFDLSNQRQVIQYDQLGSGKSSSLDKRYWKTSTFVQQLHDVVAQLGIKKFHLFGVSWGASLALEYYRSCKGKGIESVILSSPLISEPVWSIETAKLVRALPKKEREIIEACERVGATDAAVYQQAVGVFNSRHLRRKKLKLSPELEKHWKLFNHNIYLHLWGTSEFNATGRLKGWDGTSILRSIDCPLSIMCGQFDESTPGANRRFTAMNSNAKLTIVPQASHSTLYENRKFTVGAVRKFLSEVEQRR